MEYAYTYGQYQQDLEKGRFFGLRCPSCGTVVFPPAGVCRECGGTHLDDIPLSGKGAIRTFTVIRVAPEGMEPPYVVALVELEEGPWVMGNLLGMDAAETEMAVIGKEVTLDSLKVKGDTYSGGESWVLAFRLRS